MRLRTLISLGALSLTLGVGLTAPGMAAAQDDSVRERGPRGKGGCHGRHGHRGKHHVRRMLSELDLTDNQQQQVDAILETTGERRKELFEQGRSPQTREQMRALHKETRELIRDVLTDEQIAELEQKREQRHERRVDRRIERMTRHLELSDGQARRIRTIFDNAHEQTKQLFEGNQEPEARREAMRGLFEQTRDSVRQVLDAEQREKMDDFMERRKHHRRGGPRGR